MAEVIGTLASVGMAIGPPLCYVDQAISIIRKKDSSGFSHDVCGVIIIASIIRIFFWLGRRFETALLVQSLLLIVAMLVLLSICLHYAPHHDDPAYSALPLDTGVPLDPASPSVPSTPSVPTHLTHPNRGAPAPLRAEDFEHVPGSSDDEDDTEMGTYHQPSAQPETDHDLDHDLDHDQASSHTPPKRIDTQPVSWKTFVLGRPGGRPFGFWQWRGFGAYLEFMAGLIVVLGVLQVLLGRYMWYIDLLGFVALTIEATLPIPQFMANWRRKSCYGFRSSTLAGWLFGDSFKTAYYFIRGNPVQFKATGLLTICFDIGVLTQRIVYGVGEPRSLGKIGGRGSVSARGDAESVVFQVNANGDEEHGLEHRHNG